MESLRYGVADVYARRDPVDFVQESKAQLVGHQNH